MWSYYYFTSCPCLLHPSSPESCRGFAVVVKAPQQRISRCACVKGKLESPIWCFSLLGGFSSYLWLSFRDDWSSSVLSRHWSGLHSFQFLFIHPCNHGLGFGGSSGSSCFLLMNTCGMSYSWEVFQKEKLVCKCGHLVNMSFKLCHGISSKKVRTLITVVSY